MLFHGPRHGPWVVGLCQARARGAEAAGALDAAGAAPASGEENDIAAALDVQPAIAGRRRR
jgi:hypothetical protein